MSAPLLEVTGLKTHFESARGTIKAVDGVSFNVARGEVLGLVGESGSGKSVTGFSLIGLIDAPGRIVEGSIKLDGRELVGLPGRDLRAIRGRSVSMVFQDPMMTLNPVLSIGTQLKLAMRAHQKISSHDARLRGIAALDQVRIADAEHKIDLFPHQFSGGMRQRVAIAIALLHRPKLVIADEPTTALDVSVQAEILSEMRELVRELGTSLIWISHDLATVSSIAQRVAVMKNGRIVETGPISKVLFRPEHAYTRSLLDALPSRAEPGQMLGANAGEVIEMPARVVQAAKAAAVGDDDRGFMTVEGVVKRFDRQPSFSQRLVRRIKQDAPLPPPILAVDNVSFTLRRGEALGLVGESGSGKSTLGRMASGIYMPTEGRVLLDGQPITNWRGRKNTTRVQMIFQDPFASLDPRMSIASSIVEGPLAHGLTTRKDADAFVAQWLKAVGLSPEFASRYPHQFSGGQRQRVAIARAMAMQPDVVVCDEPVASLDVSIQAQIINLLLTLRKELNLTLLFISHDLSVIRHLCDNVLVMYRGKIVERGDCISVFDAPQHAYTTMLINSIPKLQDSSTPEPDRTTEVAAR